MTRPFVALLGSAAVGVCITLTGCAPTPSHSAPLTIIHPGRSLPITPELRRMAEANYRESLKITYSVVARGATTSKLIALTIDDGPHPSGTEALLRTMTSLGIHGTFFVVGKMAQKSPYLIQEEILQGSEVANHTYNHIHVTSLNDAQIGRELFSTNDVVQRYTGFPTVLFRPPGGRISWGAYRALRACGAVTVLWTDDPKDYANPGKGDPVLQKLLLQRLMAHIRPGGIILLHDGIKDTVAILPEFVHRMEAQGYHFVTVTQLLLAKQKEEADAQQVEHLRKQSGLPKPPEPGIPPASMPAAPTGAYP